ncbi:MAG: hypothetical protein HJJLKODD_00204 [Phycisphaerae bacterium]|nr:hypothetical protein [Phycisphaerae bacterium]
MQRVNWILSLALLGLVIPSATVKAETGTETTIPALFSLAQDNGDQPAEPAAPAEPMADEPMSSGDEWDIAGYVNMRPADPQPLGTFDLKVFFDYSTASDGSDDDFFTRFAWEWGFLENHELVLKLPINYGDGEEGNADISVGWHWRLWKEDGWIPAFAIYNEVRLPTGNDSSGVDWEIRPIITKSIIENSLRLHVNPFFKWLGGDNIETNAWKHAGDNTDEDRPFGWNERGSTNWGGNSWFWNRDRKTDREFQAGSTFGLDYKLTDAATVNFNYILDSGVLNGYGMQHSMEAGIDYNIMANQWLTWSTRWTLDGDSQGDNWGMVLGYVIRFDGPKMGWRTAEVPYPWFE